MSAAWSLIPSEQVYYNVINAAQEMSSQQQVLTTTIVGSHDYAIKRSFVSIKV